MRRVLGGEKGNLRNVVVMNAAAALVGERRAVEDLRRRQMLGRPRVEVADLSGFHQGGALLVSDDKAGMIYRIAPRR